MSVCYISLGSNAANSHAMLRVALEKLTLLPGVRITLFSPIFITEPQGFKEQPWFKNMAIKMELTDTWEAAGLMRSLLHIEKEMGRERDPANRFGPRRIDLDLLCFNDRISRDRFCTLPHPRMLERAFVLLPLLAIEPALIVNGKSIVKWLAELDWRLHGWRIWQA